MSPDDLCKLCVETISQTTGLGYPEDQARAMLVTPKGWRPPPKFPRGELLQVKENGERLWVFKSVRVLKWLRDNGATV